MTGAEPWLMCLPAGRFMGNELCRVLLTLRGNNLSSRYVFGLSMISSIASGAPSAVLEGKNHLVRDLAADDSERTDE
jgi:hypothetical protein